MPTLFDLVFAVGPGATISIYTPTNGAIAKVVGSPVVATGLSDVVSLLTSLALANMPLRQYA